MTTFRETPKLVEIGQKYRSFSVKTSELFFVADDITSPQKCCLEVKWYRVDKVAKEV